MKVFRFVIQAILISCFLGYFWLFYTIGDEIKTKGSINLADFNRLMGESLFKGVMFALPSVAIIGYYYFKKRKE